MSGQKKSNFAPQIAALLAHLSDSETVSFKQMAKLAGLDPAGDFVGSDLSGLDFRDDDLSGFNFSEADLRFTDFRRANLEGVIFSGAKLQGAIGLPEPAPADATETPKDLRELKRMIASGRLPPQLFVESTRELRFGDTAIVDIGILAAFPSLRRLSLINRRIRDFSPIGHMPSLKYLELRGSNISSLLEIGPAENLLSLDAGFSRIKDVRGIENLRKLKKINISYTDVSDLTPIAHSSVEEIIAVGTKVTSTTPLKGATKLISVNLSRSAIATMDGIAGNPKMQAIYASGTGLDNVDGISKLAELRILDISETKVKNIEVIGNLRKLRVLRANNNKGIAPLEGLENNRELVEISLSGCAIKKVGVNLALFGELEVLHLSDNDITEIFLSDFVPKLRLLWLAKNPIENLSFLKAMPNLTWLNVTGTKIKDFAPILWLRNVSIIQADAIPLEVVRELAGRGGRTRIEIADEYYRSIEESIASVVGSDGVTRFKRRDVNYLSAAFYV